jgi:Fur family transcriptional regulator, ferric uptake regulator
MIPPQIQEKLEAHYRKHGMRRTSPRELIVATAFAGEDHFTAEELWERARARDPGTSRATVYRTLGMLVAAGVLREVELGQGQTCYDPNFVDRPNHNHLVCVDCGRVIEFEDSHLEVLNECLTRRLGFRARRQSLRIEACCDQLRQTGRCPHLIATRLKGRRLPGRKR